MSQQGRCERCREQLGALPYRNGGLIHEYSFAA
jgi:hypothetical protein